VGIVAPYLSESAGVVAAGFVASILGQGLGNYFSSDMSFGQSFQHPDLVLATASAFGGESGWLLGSGLRWGEAATAVSAGVGAGFSELGAATHLPHGPVDLEYGYNMLLGNACPR
jgi:hypothetical protein